MAHLSAAGARVPAGAEVSALDDPRAGFISVSMAIFIAAVDPNRVIGG